MTAAAVFGVVAGCRLALLAFGFGLVYYTTGIFHFAHGAVYVVAGYTAWWLTAVAGWPLSAGFAAGLVMATVLGLGIEVGLYRPLRDRRASLDVLFLTSLGAFGVAVNALALAFGHETRVLAVPNRPLLRLPGAVVLTTVHAGVLAVSAVAFLSAWLVLTRTAFGLRLRAYAANPSLGEALGLSGRSLLPAAVAAGSFLAGLAALATACDTGVQAQMGLEAVVVGAVAVVVGGVGSMPGTVVGGLLIGLLRGFTAFYLGARWEDGVTFGLLLLVLLLRPNGLFGSARR